jgi:hypothetical protein
MSILLMSIECPWDSGCRNQVNATPLQSPPSLTPFSSQFQRWEAIGVIDIATDLALFSVSVLLVKDLQMSWQPKAVVVAAFGTRIL